MSFEGRVENGVIVLDAPQPLAEGTRVEVIVHGVGAEKGDMTISPTSKPSRTSLADWAEQNGEHWGTQLSSEDVEGFTGRRF